MAKTRNLETGSGISRELAEHRQRTVSNLRYALRLSLPADPRERISGQVTIRFSCMAEPWPAIDFAPFAEDDEIEQALHAVEIDGRAASYAVREGHIVLLEPRPAAGEHAVSIRFTAGAAGLRRRPGLVYTLFVPARAHTCFPCLDQPDLKAQLELTLGLPAAWQALSNAGERTRSEAADRATIQFAPSEPLPTYALAFVAGELTIQSHAVGERRMLLAHRTDAAVAIARDLDAILALHARALTFLESYTGIAYPFTQFGCAIIPDFDFAGMEHPGVTLYREEFLLLGPESSEHDRIHRANLIAHETAHHWFGNLVTMRWFDDVWLKEVFANFLADKIVAIAFPDADHALRFMLQHYPPAYAIDRTEGAHPIRQSLDNLAHAAELYDALIYHKAPVAMAELERQTGEPALRRGLRHYLRQYEYGNADWTALQACLSRETEADIPAFNQRWIDAIGRPELGERIRFDADAAYGRSNLDDRDRERGLIELTSAKAPRTRATAWLVLYEDMLDGGLAPSQLLTAALTMLTTETEPLLVTRVLDDSFEIYWRFLEPSQRAIAAGPVERCLRRKTMEQTEVDLGGTRYRLFWLASLSRFASSDEMLAELESIWSGAEPGFDALPESVASTLALTLALHRKERADSILERQIALTDSENRCARLEFLLPAVAPDRPRRDAFFTELIRGEARARWIVAGARLLNHALDADGASHYITPSLRFAAELHSSGDIFLPRQWLMAALSGHGTPEAAGTIRDYLGANELAPRFRQLVLQCADPVFRAASIRS